MEVNISQVQSATYPIYVGNDALSELDEFLNQNYPGSKYIILVDENTKEHCLPVVKSQVSAINGAKIFEIPSGEEHKSLGVCISIWQQFTEWNIDRKSVVLNLGGGVLADLGGFVASTFKRGLDFINIPTTLLSQVDASIGGKVGVDFAGFKNQIGAFSNPAAIFSYTPFLDSIEYKDAKDGLAEAIKHCLIWDEIYWDMLISLDIEQRKTWDSLISLSVKIKSRVVLNDPRESGLRKILNFGHTIGHAVELHLLDMDEAVAHGRAVAMGMICECFISNMRGGLNSSDLEQVIDLINQHFEPVEFEPADYPSIMRLMRGDKKNINGKINFTLLASLGEATYNNFVEEPLILESLNFYRERCLK